MKLKKLSSLLVAFVIACGLLAAPAYATDQHPMDHGSSTEASVSDEKDATHGTDNGISTQFFLFIPRPPSVSDVPEMGDSGVDLNYLIVFTIGVGVAYLVSSRYAKSIPKDC